MKPAPVAVHEGSPLSKVMTLALFVIVVLVRIFPEPEPSSAV